MNSPWLYQHLGSLAQVLGFSFLVLIGILAFLRRRKSRMLAKSKRADKRTPE